MPEIFYGSLAVGPIIVVLIALLKRIGLPAEYAPWANVGLSLLFVALVYVTGIYPDIQQPVTTALNIIVAVLTAAGLYTLQKDATMALRE